MRPTLLRTVTMLLAATVLLAACGDDDDTVTGDTSTTEDETTTTTSSTTTAPDPGDLPGERVEIFPYEDAEIGVVGVEADDTLNVRAGPGVDFDVVTELEPLTEGILATGHNRSVGDAGFWAEITVDGETGWANTKFLMHIGRVDDITTEIAPTPADRPTAETMLELGQMVAETRTPDAPPQTDVVVVDGPTADDVDSDLGEITIDVIGFGDDAQGGVRLHIFAEPDPGGESFTLRTVERTLLCLRGLSEDDICV